MRFCTIVLPYTVNTFPSPSSVLIQFHQTKTPDLTSCRPVRFCLSVQGVQ